MEASSYNPCLFSNQGIKFYFCSFSQKKTKNNNPKTKTTTLEIKAFHLLLIWFSSVLSLFNMELWKLQRFIVTEDQKKLFMSFSLRSLEFNSGLSDWTGNNTVVL